MPYFKRPERPRFQKFKNGPASEHPRKHIAQNVQEGHYLRMSRQPFSDCPGSPPSLDGSCSRISRNRSLPQKTLQNIQKCSFLRTSRKVLPQTDWEEFPQNIQESPCLRAIRKTLLQNILDSQSLSMSRETPPSEYQEKTLPHNFWGDLDLKTFKKSHALESLRRPSPQKVQGGPGSERPEMSVSEHA